MFLIKWLDLSTIIANCITSLGVLGLVGFYIHYQHSQKQFRFTVMISCIERYQTILPALRKSKVDKDTLIKYIDLTSEEFFYFQNGYIPAVVAIEWLDSIIDNFPVYDGRTAKPINYSKLSFREIHNNSMLNNYPRLLTNLRVSGKYDASIFSAETNKKVEKKRIELITEIGNNMGISFRRKDFRKALVYYKR